jgi:ribosomal protein S18 acetylase RimI-like enzyme
MTIEEIAAADAPMDLLLLADPSREKILGYLPRSRCFVVRDGGAVVGACLVTPIGPRAHELMNIAVAPQRQQAGVGARLLRHVIDAVGRTGAERLEVGTGAFGHPLAFYQRQGFRVTGIQRDFFLQHYDEPVIEAGMQHKDMLRLTLIYPIEP